MLLCCLPALSPEVSFAEQDLTSPEVAVEAGQEALADQWSLEWYDADADDFKPVQQNPPKPQTKPNSNWSWGESLWDFFSSWSFDISGLLKLLLYLLLIAVVVGIVWAIVRAIQQAELQQAGAVTEEEEDARSHIERVEALPVVVERRVDNLLAEARRLLASGDGTLAIVYLFSHQLVQLDKQRLLHLVKGKTNRQYLRELRKNAADRPRLGAILSETTLVFERAFFGAHPPSQAKLEACFATADEFDRVAAIRSEEPS